MEGRFVSEVWKSVPGFSDYQVSSNGRVKRIKNHLGQDIDRPMARTLNPNGYYKMLLHQKGKGATRYVHEMVANAFHGAPKGDRNQINHKNGNKQNNKASNLEWTTRSENMKHAYDAGLVGGKGANKKPD